MPNYPHITMTPAYGVHRPAYMSLVTMQPLKAASDPHYLLRHVAEAQKKT